MLEDSGRHGHRLADYKGRWVLVNIWATWCAPCLQEIPELVSLAERRKDLQVIGVAIDWHDRAQVLQFSEGMLMTCPIVLGDRKLVKQLGDITGLPTGFIYDPAGTLVVRHTGALTRQLIDGGR